MEANRGRPKTDQPTEQSTKNGRWRTTANGYLAEGVGFEPTRERKPPGGFQDRCLKPLGHPSTSATSMTWRYPPRNVLATSLPLDPTWTQCGQLTCRIVGGLAGGRLQPI